MTHPGRAVPATRLALLAPVLCAAAVAAAALGPVPAHAGEPVYLDAPAPAEWQEAAARARTHWAREPDCPSGAAVLTMRDPAPVGASAQLPGCVIWVNLTWAHTIVRPRDRCILMAHEWGHLLGLPHSSGGLMDPGPAMYLETLPACDGAPGAEPGLHPVPPVAADAIAGGDHVALVTPPAPEGPVPPAPAPPAQPARGTPQVARPGAPTLRAAASAARRRLGRTWTVARCRRSAGTPGTVVCQARSTRTGARRVAEVRRVPGSAVLRVKIRRAPQ